MDVTAPLVPAPAPHDALATQPKDVLIIERMALLRRSLLVALAADPTLRVAGEAATAEEGWRLAEDLAPDVALVGTTLEDALGFAAVAGLRERSRSAAIVVIGRTGDDDELFAALRSGAAGYVGPDIEGGQLVALVQEAAAGRFPIDGQALARPGVAALIMAQFRPTHVKDPTPIVPLTERELAVLREVANGGSNVEIGEALGLSPQTVKNHLASVLRKMAVNDRTHAVVEALRQGWLSLDDDHNRVPTVSPRRPPKE